MFAIPHRQLNRRHRNPGLGKVLIGAIVLGGGYLLLKEKPYKEKPYKKKEPDPAVEVEVDAWGAPTQWTLIEENEISGAPGIPGAPVAFWRVYKTTPPAEFAYESRCRGPSGIGQIKTNTLEDARDAAIQCSLEQLQ